MMIQIIDMFNYPNDKDRSFAFGINTKQDHMFLNGLSVKDKDVEDCLISNAEIVLQEVIGSSSCQISIDRYSQDLLIYTHQLHPSNSLVLMLFLVMLQVLQHRKGVLVLA